MNIKTSAFIIGIFYAVVGILGFVPGVTIDGRLFDTFMVDSTHNIVHLLTGAIGLIAASNLGYARIYFQVLGVVYGLITILGFALQGDLYIIHVNTADNVLHLFTALISLYLGFLAPEKTVVRM